MASSSASCSATDLPVGMSLMLQLKKIKGDTKLWRMPFMNKRCFTFEKQAQDTQKI